jgi:hypothetical protein
MLFDISDEVKTHDFLGQQGAPGGNLEAFFLDCALNIEHFCETSAQ